MKSPLFSTTLMAAFFCVALFGARPDAQAQVDGFGVGIIIGNPTGVTGKYFFDDRNALDVDLAWWFAGSSGLLVNVDYLWHWYGVINPRKGEMPLYAGVGGRVLFANQFGLGVRVPLGIAYHFDTAPIDIFAEVAPGVDFIPGTNFRFGGGIGARYYF